MSRIGKNEVVVPEGVNFSIEGRILSVKGKLGELTEEITDLVKVEYKDNPFNKKKLLSEIPTRWKNNKRNTKIEDEVIIESSDGKE